jgi:4-diphosphocytidyl-2C-methyl-D-erythritol kinase
VRAIERARSIESIRIAHRLWNLNLSLSELSAIGLKLGADVPFFLFGSNAWVSWMVSS